MNVIDLFIFTIFTFQNGRFISIDKDIRFELKGFRTISSELVIFYKYHWKSKNSWSPNQLSNSIKKKLFRAIISHGVFMISSFMYKQGNNV